MSNAKIVSWIGALRSAIYNPRTTALQESDAIAVENGLAGYLDGRTQELIIRISQATTAAPTLGATLKNTITGTPTPTFARTAQGVYQITGVVTTAAKDKTSIEVTNGGTAFTSLTATVVASDKLEIRTFDAAGAAVDAQLTDCQIKVIIFP